MELTKVNIFRNKVLWRVYLVWFFRKILPLILLQIGILIFALKIFAQEVFVGKVLENAALASDANYWQFIKYLATAFLQTHFLVQIAVLLVLGIGALLLRDAGRSLLVYANTLRKRSGKQ